MFDWSVFLSHLDTQRGEEGYSRQPHRTPRAGPADCLAKLMAGSGGSGRALYTGLGVRGQHRRAAGLPLGLLLGLRLGDQALRQDPQSQVSRRRWTTAAVRLQGG